MEIWDLTNGICPQRLSATEIIYFGADIPVEGIVVVGDMAYVAGDWGFCTGSTCQTRPYPQVGFNGQAVRPTDVVATSDHVYAVGNDTGAFSKATSLFTRSSQMAHLVMAVGAISESVLQLLLAVITPMWVVEAGISSI